MVSPDLDLAVLALNNRADVCVAQIGDLVRELAAVVGGRGGGKPTLAQAGGPDADKLDEALSKVPEKVKTLING